MVHRLRADDAQTFVDVVHQARHPLAYRHSTHWNELCLLGTGKP